MVKAPTKVNVSVSAPNILTVLFKIRGTSPYVQNKFSAKAREEMKLKQEAGSTAKKGVKREAKNFQERYEGAMHRLPDGGYGIPAPAFRNGLISSCRLVGFTMTHAKMSIFIEPDGFDVDDGTPLVRITKGEPSYSELPVRNESGVADIRPRPMWAAGWEALLKVQFDADQFTATDVSNLLLRMGVQNGVGEGRPNSKQSNGMGWGTFTVLQSDDSPANQAAMA